MNIGLVRLSKLTGQSLKHNYLKTLETKAKEAFEQQKYIQVIELCNQYLKQDLKNPYMCAYFGFSVLRLKSVKEFKLANEYLSKAIKMKPDEPLFYVLMGNLIRDAVKTDSAINYYIKALQLDVNYHEALYNLGVAYCSLGEMEKGIDLFINAISINANLKYLEDLNHYIYYDPRYKNKDFQKVATLYYQTLKAKHKIEPYTYTKERLDPNKTKLRLGFFCGEHIDTPTWPFLEQVFLRMNKDHFEIYNYLKPKRLDYETPSVQNLRGKCDKWVYCHELSTQATAELIHNDNIDILIDLSGYLPGVYGFDSLDPSMNVFAYRPAPVQITWYGFWGTSGFPEMDYFITSKDAVPEDQEQYFTEKVYRLPNALLHSSIVDKLPDIEESPFLKNGYITFGSFARTTKLNSHQLKIWADLLNRVPGSKLLIKHALQPIEYISKRVRSELESHGCDGNRVEFEYKPCKRFEFLTSYNKIDIALDTIPFIGVTTAMNAITMGVPIITKHGDTVVGGGTASILKTLELDEFIAQTDEEYIDLAVKLANDPEKLQEFRKTLRAKSYQSSLNVDTFTKDLEDAFDFIWKDCCQK